MNAQEKREEAVKGAMLEKGNELIERSEMDGICYLAFQHSITGQVYSAFIGKRGGKERWFDGRAYQYAYRPVTYWGMRGTK